MDLQKLLWLVGLIGFFIGLAVMLLKLDHSDAWKHAHIAQLVLNKDGGFDIAAVAFWAGFLFSIFVLVYCVLKNSVPSGLAALYGIFIGSVLFPLLAKIVFHAKTIPTLPSFGAPPSVPVPEPTEDIPKP